MLAAEEASRQEEAERFATAHRMHGARQAGDDRVENTRRAFEEAERQAVDRRRSEETAQRALDDAAREAAEQSAHMAAEEAAHRIRQETARLAAEAERLAGEDDAGAASRSKVDATGESGTPTDDRSSPQERSRR